MSQRDIIGWVVDWLLANETAITEDLIATFERESRAEWGGQEVRVWKTSDGKAGRRRHYDAQQAYADGMSKLPDQAVMEKHGISRRTLYRLLKRGPGSTE